MRKSINLLTVSSRHFNGFFTEVMSSYIDSILPYFILPVTYRVNLGDSNVKIILSYTGDDSNNSLYIWHSCCNGNILINGHSSL